MTSVNHLKFAYYNDGQNPANQTTGVAQNNAQAPPPPAAASDQTSAQNSPVQQQSGGQTPGQTHLGPSQQPSTQNGHA